MKVTKHVTKIVGLAAMAAVAVGFASAAQASPVPPKASTTLLGTWVNTNPNSGSVKQIVVSPTRVGNVTVDAFGSCHPSLCEWGVVPANVYGATVSSPTGATFQSNQRFLTGDKEWSRTTLLGNVVRTKAGSRLTLRELTVFEDGSGRKNYNVTETFKLGKGLKPTHLGNSVASYVRGTPPALISGALGNWKNVSPSGGLVGVTITGSAANPIVSAFGQCSPTACAYGKVRGITYGPTISATRGATVLAPYTFSFKKAQLVITYSVGSDETERLTISEYNEFTDGSGRSNYMKKESFVRA
jgi:hypothetical protein